MKAAFAAWHRRIAPVFDVARMLYLVDTEAGQVVQETREQLPDEPPIHKAIWLADLGVETLVCGAISRPLHDLVAAYGIRVVAFVAGDVNEVIHLWLTDSFYIESYVMPGCRRRAQQQLRGQRDDMKKGEFSMNGRKRGGTGKGGGRGQGRGGQRPDRTGGSAAVGTNGFCICPQCGQQEIHQRGVPCFERQCPKCGAAMTRQ